MGTSAGRTRRWPSSRVGPLAAELAGIPFAELFADAGQVLMACARTRPVECALRRPTGADRRVICQLAWRDLAPGSDVWSFEDVTQLRAAELELLRTSQDLHRANREAASLREELRAEREGREELLAVVSHELRTPVTVIGGYSRLLLAGDAGPVTDEQRRFLLESAKSCQRLNEFIGKLIEASREKKGGEVLELGSHALQPVIETVRELLLPLAAESDSRILVRIDSAAAVRPLRPAARPADPHEPDRQRDPARAAPRRSSRSRRARCRRRWAAVASSRSASRTTVRASLRSTGNASSSPGSSSPEAGGRAASGSGSRSAGGWSRRTAARSRWRSGPAAAAGSASRCPQRTRPGARRSASRGAGPQPSGRQVARASPRRGAGRRVLVVDDAEAIRTYLAHLLELRGYEVDTAEDGRSALALLEGGAAPDVVLLDVMMPGQDGLATLARIREEHPGVSVVMLSVVGKAATIVEAMQLGAADYLNKPFEEAELEAALARVFERRALEQERVALGRRARRAPARRSPGRARRCSA